MYFNTNPFEKRVTEYLADGPTFVDVVSPEPIESFIEPEAPRLYDRLVEIIGSPGSGKTTIAKIFQFNNLFTVTRNSGSDAYKSLFDILVRCRAATEDSQPAVIACRLPLEGEYRDIWELPYSDDIKSRLFFSLLQARAVLSWFRYIEDVGLDPDKVVASFKTDQPAAIESVGGTSGPSLRRRAAEVEREVYGVTAALVAPLPERISPNATKPYEPFAVLKALAVTVDGDRNCEMHPLAMLDDAHSLHPDQLRRLIEWLSRRDIPVGRWLLMRFDALSEDAVLATGLPVDGSAGGLLPQDVQRAREITVIRMQRDDKRAEDRRRFRSMARRMCSRYLQLMPVFQRRHIRDINQYLAADPPTASETRVAQIQAATEKTIVAKRLDPESVGEIRREVESSSNRPADVTAQAFLILLNRYMRRRPQAALIEGLDDDLGKKPLAISSGLFEGAEIQLMHGSDRPFYYGLDKIADASMENAEQFLRLMRELVRILESNAIRTRTIVKPLSVSVQHRTLRRTAEDAVNSWNFPESDRVRRLADYIGDRCVRRSLEPNAALGAGPNAVGILEEDFRTIVERQPRLARVIKYGIAYNAFHLKRGHKTKSQTWCLLTLGGTLCLKYGLTLTLGGFLDNIPLRQMASLVNNEDDG